MRSLPGAAPRGEGRRGRARVPTGVQSGSGQSGAAAARANPREIQPASSSSCPKRLRRIGTTSVSPPPPFFFFYAVENLHFVVRSLATSCRGGASTWVGGGDRRRGDRLLLRTDARRAGASALLPDSRVARVGAPAGLPCAARPPCAARSRQRACTACDGPHRAVARPQGLARRATRSLPGSLRLGAGRGRAPRCSGGPRRARRGRVRGRMGGRARRAARPALPGRDLPPAPTARSTRRAGCVLLRRMPQRRRRHPRGRSRPVETSTPMRSSSQATDSPRRSCPSSRRARGDARAGPTEPLGSLCTAPALRARATTMAPAPQDMLVMAACATPRRRPTDVGRADDGADPGSPRHARLGASRRRPPSRTAGPASGRHLTSCRSIGAVPGATASGSPADFGARTRSACVRRSCRARVLGDSRPSSQVFDPRASQPRARGAPGRVVAAAFERNEGDRGILDRETGRVERRQLGRANEIELTAFDSTGSRDPGSRDRPRCARGGRRRPRPARARL